MYTVLARIKKDREKVRIFCCDALYCLGVHAILILYTVFTSWPEVFPNNETSTNSMCNFLNHFKIKFLFRYCNYLLCIQNYCQNVWHI